MATRIYHVKLKVSRKPAKSYLVEARSQEEAVRKVTEPMIESVTIPTPLEAFRLQSDGATIISDSVQPAVVDQEPSANNGDGSVGRMGLSQTDGDDSGGESGEQVDVTASGGA